jgi:hypothetical protein
MEQNLEVQRVVWMVAQWAVQKVLRKVVQKVEHWDTSMAGLLVGS